MHLSLPYVQWMLAGSPLLFVYIIYASILRGVGDSTTPLLALALTSVIGLVITRYCLKVILVYLLLRLLLQQSQRSQVMWLF